VRSPAAHARITSIDTSGATAMPATQVFTGADLGLPPLPIPPFLGLDQGFARPMLASEVVRFVGDIVAIVLTESLAAGFDAAEQVYVEYEGLPAVIDPAQAVDGDVLLFPEMGTNVCLKRPGSGEDIVQGCEVVVPGQLVSQRMAACPLESRACAASFEDGRLTTWLSTQTPHTDRDGLAGLLGLDASNVR